MYINLLRRAQDVGHSIWGAEKQQPDNLLFWPLPCALEAGIICFIPTSALPADDTSRAVVCTQARVWLCAHAELLPCPLSTALSRLCCSETCPQGAGSAQKACQTLGVAGGCLCNLNLLTLIVPLNTALVVL